MIPLTITVPDVETQVQEALSGGADVIHLYCCRPDVAVCGEDLTGGEDVPEDEPGDRCIRCLFIDEANLPCGAAFCRLRSLWRSWRSS